MKALDWHNFFAEQQAAHGKVVFSVAELANAARTTLHALNTELGRLVRRGLIVRYAQGRYGPARGVAPHELAPEVDPGAYVTGLYALFLHHRVTQAPSEVVCFTNRRHHRRPDRDTPAGRLRFIRVPADIYAKPAGVALAAPEQALCDFVWLSLREGLDPKSLVTFRNLSAFNRRCLKKVARRYPERVRRSVAAIASFPPDRPGVV